MHVKGDVHQLTVDHALDDTWSVRAGVMYLKNLLDGLGVEPRTVQADGRTLTRRSSWRRIPSQDTSLQAEITGKLDTAGIRHTVLAGAMLSRYVYENDIRYSSERVTPYSIDIYAPVYGQPMPAYRATRSARYQRDTTQALYVQDQLDLSTQWKLMAGLRLDRFDQHARALTGSGWTGQQHRYTQLTPRVGATTCLIRTAPPSCRMDAPSGPTVAPRLPVTPSNPKRARPGSWATSGMPRMAA